MYFYKKTGPGLFTVGFEDSQGNWHADSDHDNVIKARKTVHYLNGGQPLGADAKEINYGGNAFPGYGEGGMSLRDYFAGQALQGLLANNDVTVLPLQGDIAYEVQVQLAVTYADALIQTLQPK